MLCAGSCIEGIAVAELYGCSPVCLEIQKTLVRIGKRYAQQHNLEIKAIVSDVSHMDKVVAEREFDLALLWGNSLPHFSIWQTDHIISSVHSKLKPNGILLIEQLENISRNFLQREFTPFVREKSIILSIPGQYNAREGKVENIYIETQKNEVHAMARYLWSPWIIEYMLGVRRKFKCIETVDAGGGVYFIAGFKADV